MVVLSICLALPGPARADGYEAGEISVKLLPGSSIEEFTARWDATLLERYDRGRLYLIWVETEEDLEHLAEMMTDDPAAEWAEANYFQETPESQRMMVVNAIGGTFADYEDQEITERIGLDAAHFYSRGEGVVIAVLDTGIDPDHEAFAGRLASGGYDFVDRDSDPTELADGIDEDGDGLVDEGYGHGTMVAGIAALVAPAARLLPIRVLDDEGRADAFRIAMAISHALDQGATVLNMSFGAPQEIATIGHLIDLATAQGAVVVSGAGNCNEEDPPYYPAIHEDAYMVTALDSLDRKADFADWNRDVLVSAPGTGVRSAYPEDNWALGAGCSFAVPFVVGEVALIRSFRPGRNLTEIRHRVEGAIVEIYDIPENEAYDGELGSGRIYLPAALTDPADVAGGVEARALRLCAYPNPAAGSVRFAFPRDPRAPFTIEIFDLSGRKVADLGSTGFAVEWNRTDPAGRRVPSGTYFARGDCGGGASRTVIRLIH